MDKQYLIGLTKIVYKLTLLFPKKEPLRYKTRETADEILASFINATKKDIAANLEVLDSFLEVAKAQNWVKLEELLAIQKEYAKLKQSGNQNVGLQNQITRNAARAKLSGAATMSERQERILSFLKEHGRAQVWQIKEILPEVTKRTLRRDFEALLKQGLIERIGERNNTFYQIKPGSRNLTGV
jgi:DNA-binding transcriptional ArsR family regulator